MKMIPRQGDPAPTEDIVGAGSPCPYVSGFTLLELMVVLFILSLMAAVVFPSLHVMDGKGVNAEARRLASVLRYVNDTAISAKQTCSLKFNFGDDSVEWKGPDFGKKESFGAIAGVILPSRGEVREGELTVFFSPLGGQENLTIILKDESGSAKVVFNPMSGRVKIETGNGA